MRKQLPIRVEEDFLKRIKIMLVMNDMTFNDYVIGLIEKDLREREESDNV